MLRTRGDGEALIVQPVAPIFPGEGGMTGAALGAEGGVVQRADRDARQRPLMARKAVGGRLGEADAAHIHVALGAGRHGMSALEREGGLSVSGHGQDGASEGLLGMALLAGKARCILVNVGVTALAVQRHIGAALRRVALLTAGLAMASTQGEVGSTVVKGHLVPGLSAVAGCTVGAVFSLHGQPVWRGLPGIGGCRTSHADGTLRRLPLPGGCRAARAPR